MQPERPFADYELSGMAQSLAEQFVQRWDLHARQLEDGRYICIHHPLKDSHMLAHLRGEITLGTYLLNQQSEARFIVFDADDPKQFSNLRYLADTLEAENVPSYLEQSRRGGHLWLFFYEAVPGTHAREFGQGLLTVHQIKPMELFPKQDRLSGGPGSLIRMPFGVHRRSGQRYGFINTEGEPIAPTIRQQIKLLSTPQMVPEAAFKAYLSCVPFQPQNPVLDALGSPRELVSQRIKDKISVLELISQYVDVKPTDKGAIGLCPFHDDHNPSLSINDQGNYWNCFAGCGGGSVIDFYMMWADCDFVDAVTELAHMLL